MLAFAPFHGFIWRKSDEGTWSSPFDAREVLADLKTITVIASTARRFVRERAFPHFARNPESSMVFVKGQANKVIVVGAISLRQSSRSA
jgi:hypothetical protein